MNSFNKNSIMIGAILGGLAVALGAFGAHALKTLLIENNRVETFELAVKYQFYHALAIMVLGSIGHQLHEKRVLWSRTCFILGTTIFSGSLYLLSLSGKTFWGAITPIGGASLIAGWALLAFASAKLPK